MTLKLARLPKRSPVKVTCAFSPEVHAALEAYAALYQETYGENEPIEELVPFIVAAFLEKDAGFKKARRTRTPRIKSTAASPPITATAKDGD